ncbi:glycine oxidase ThiO [Synechococcus sp. RedBA-s]|uniref:glycine oxidase ThiO n=1 Tax=Synechococcus sp. RedBA-s TaxID=2823741 RepID=UPI0020CF6CCB|nr:glycine oxidase ThiO [Synechococcus sp. RedBA-s]
MASRGMDGVVVVLGGGLIGLTIAHQLARRGRSVHVLSRSRSEAAGFVAAGMLAPHAEGLAGPLLELGQRSLERIPAWVAEIEADSGLASGLRPCGIVVPFSSAAERDAYPTAHFGEPLDRPALERQVPGLGPSWRAGLLFSQDGQIDNRRRLMRALERACVALGVVFEEGSEVSELLVQGGRLEGVRRRRIEGSEAVLTCGEAVLTCGAWSAQLLPQLPVRPIKGQMLSLQGPRQALRRVLFGPGTYLVPRDDGLLVVGATSEPEAGFSAGLTPQGQRQLQDGLAALLPEAAHWPPMERWWGFRPGTPDEAPLLGPSPIEGLTLATGHYRNGVLLAAVTADLLLQEPLKPELERLLAAFRWDRFGAPQSDPFSSPSVTARV